MVEIVKRYATGVGHIDARDGRWLVSFYAGRGRVAQRWCDSLHQSRFTLRRLAVGR